MLGHATRTNLISRLAGQSDAFFLPDSFVSCKNASVEHNFVDIYGGVITYIFIQW